MIPLLAWSLRAAATVALGLLLTLALRRRSAATRNLVLRATLVVALALPLIAVFTPRVEVPVRSPLPPSGSSRGKEQGDGGTVAPALASPGWSVEAADPARPATYGLVERTAFESRFVSAPALLLALWLGGNGLLLLRWLAGLTRLLLVRRRATRTDAPDVWRAAVPVPATYGRTILLPLESDAWPEVRRRAAILHERAHVARRDWHWQTLAALFAALHWPNPLAWILARTLRDTAEAAADDAALAHMAPSDYARELLAVAKAARPVGPALAMARRDGVRDRIVGVLASGRDRRGPSARAGVLLLAAIGLCGIVVAGVAQAKDRSLRVIDVNDVSGRYWDSDGQPLAKRTDQIGYQGFSVPPSERWVKVHLDLADSRTSRGIRVEIPTPAEARSYGSRDVEGHLVELCITAPQSLSRTDVRVGLATGDWQEIPGSGAFPHTFKRIIGGNAPQYIVGVDFPARYRNDEVRIVARLRNGTEPKAIGTGMGYEDAFVRMHGSPEATLQVHGHPSDLAIVVLQHRPYVWTTLRNVALRPKVGPSPTTKLRNGIDIRLVSVREPFNSAARPRPFSLRAWAPGGEALPSVPVRFPTGAIIEPDGSPRRTVVLEVRASDAGRPAEVDAYPLNQDPGWLHEKGDDAFVSRPAWHMPRGATTQDVALAVAAGRWNVYRGPDVAFRASRQSIRTTSGPERLTCAAFAVPTAVTGRNVRIFAVLADGRRILISNAGAMGTPMVHSAGWSMAPYFPDVSPESIRRIEFETRDYERVVFPAVAMSPR